MGAATYSSDCLNDAETGIRHEMTLTWKQTILRTSLLTITLLAGPDWLRAQGNHLDLVRQMAVNENLAEERRANFLYRSTERSERTGGHLWIERVAETDAGKVRLLVAEDGQPLSASRQASERAKLRDVAAHPEEFAKREQLLKKDEHHAKEMLTLLPKAFLFDPPVKDGGYVRLAYHPNPAYSPQSLEERVLHGMSGTVEIDPLAVRLRSIEGRLPEDVSIGFGLVATIKAGSNFMTTREQVTREDWKTATIDSDVTGRAIFFKAIGKKQHAERREYKRLADDVSVAEAVALVLR